jgi:hypothetical protein
VKTVEKNPIRVRYVHTCHINERTYSTHNIFTAQEMKCRCTIVRIIRNTRAYFRRMIKELEETYKQEMEKRNAPPSWGL